MVQLKKQTVQPQEKVINCFKNLLSIEEARKFDQLDCTGNEVEEQTFLQKYQDGKMIDSEILYFQVDKVTLQKSTLAKNLQFRT